MLLTLTEGTNDIENIKENCELGIETNSCIQQEALASTCKMLRFDDKLDVDHWEKLAIDSVFKVVE